MFHFAAFPPHMIRIKAVLLPSDLFLLLFFFFMGLFLKAVVWVDLAFAHFKCSNRVILPGTLWNLSSHDSVKMEIVDHALHALSDEVMVPHSGWEQGSNRAGGGEETCKPRHLEWEVALTNTAGCLRYEAKTDRRKGSSRSELQSMNVDRKKQSGGLPENRLTEQWGWKEDSTSSQSRMCVMELENDN